MRFIGVDQSATGTAAVVLDADGTRLHHELFALKSKGPTRLLELYKSLVRIAEALGPFEVGVREGYSYGSLNQPFTLGEVGGVVQLMLVQHCKRVEECAPSALKKFISSNSSASKETVMDSVAKLTGYVYTDDNLADAHALAEVSRALGGAAPSDRRAALEVVLNIHKKGRTHKRKSVPFRGGRDVI